MGSPPVGLERAKWPMVGRMVRRVGSTPAGCRHISPASRLHTSALQQPHNQCMRAAASTSTTGLHEPCSATAR
eukprot:363060-Chlamydomonas_euryale.AAC.9